MFMVPRSSQESERQATQYPFHPRSFSRMSTLNDIINGAFAMSKNPKDSFKLAKHQSTFRVPQCSKEGRALGAWIPLFKSISSKRGFLGCAHACLDEPPFSGQSLGVVETGQELEKGSWVVMIVLALSLSISQRFWALFIIIGMMTNAEPAGYFCAWKLISKRCPSWPVGFGWSRADQWINFNEVNWTANELCHKQYLNGESTFFPLEIQFWNLTQ